MTDKDAMAMAIEALETLMLERGSIYEQAITALKERLAQDKALQALHYENERLGLYKDAYAEQEPLAWMDVDGNVSDNNDHKCFPIPLFTTPPQRTEQEPVAVKRMKEWVEFLKRQSDNGQHMNIPSSFGAGTCWELAIELEQFINTHPPQRTEPLIGCVNHDCDKCKENT
jgi:hypothetical protein